MKKTQLVLEIYPKKQEQEGFSLIEILIALTVLSLILLATISISNNSQNTAENVVKEDRDTLSIETAMARFEWDFSQIYSPLYFSHKIDPEQMTEEEGEIYNQIIDTYQSNERFSQVSYDILPIPLFQNPEKSEFIFFTTSNRRKFQDAKESNYSWVRYYLETAEIETNEAQAAVGEKAKGEDAPKIEANQILMRQVINRDVFNSEQFQWDDVKEQVLLRNVESLKFEFWKPDTEKWINDLAVIKNGVHKIHAVRLTIDYVDLNNFPKQTIRVFRPLYPQFEPENMYDYLSGKNEEKDGNPGEPQGGENE